MATTIGQPEAFAWLIASIVCSLTLSSAATTKIIISVILDPLALIWLKAAWPGVSMKVIFCLLFVSTIYEPMCWVIPPASDAATFFALIASRMEVLPWSTWPIIVTTGGLLTKSKSLSVFPSSPNSTSDSLTLFGIWPSSITTSSAVSPSIVWLIVAITPSFIKTFTSSDDFSAILEDNSLTAIKSGIMISFFFFSFKSGESFESTLVKVLSLAFSLARLTAANDLTFSLSSFNAWEIVNLPCRLFSKLFGDLTNFGAFIFFSFSKIFSSCSGLESNCLEKFFFAGFFSSEVSLTSFFSSFVKSAFGCCLESFLETCDTARLSSDWSDEGTDWLTLSSSFFKLLRVLFLLTSTETDLLLPWEKLCLIWPALKVFFSWSFPE